MFAYLQVKKAWLTLLLTGASLVSGLANGAIIASFETQVGISISSTFSTNHFESILNDKEMFSLGKASSFANGSGDLDPIDLASGESATLNAMAKGEVDTAGFAVSSWSTDGYFVIDNWLNDTPIVGDVLIDISWLTRIFTTSTIDDEAFAGFSINIESLNGDIIFNELFELDSLFEGSGLFEYMDTATINIDNLMVGSDEIEEYYIQLDVFGLSANYAEVSAPSSVLIASFALLFLYRRAGESRVQITSKVQ